MRQNLLVLLVVLASFVAFGQQGVVMIEKFDTAPADSTFQIIGEGSQSYMIFTPSTTDKKEGAASCSVKAKIGAYHGWGSYVQLLKRKTDSMPFENWATSDSLSIWIKVVNPPAIPANMVFRIHIGDRPNATDALEEYVYEHATILDTQHDWINLKIALKERYTDGTVVPNDSGFVRMPDSWNGGKNNMKLDWDKIIGWNIGLITTGWDPNANLPADSLTILLDGFQRFGFKSVPAIVFNGMSVPSTFSQWAWGQSSLSLEVGAGVVPGTNALKWTQGNEWNNGWTGIGWDVVPAFNLAGSWQQDSLKITLKCDPGVGALRAQFESGPGKKGLVFTPIADGQWHSYKLPLRNFTFQDNTTTFDSSNVDKFGVMAEASGIAGKVVWMTNIWTGNPEFDVIPPVAPTGLTITPGSFLNLVSWTDVPGEQGETYNLYFSKSPITDVTAPGVDVVKLKVGESLQLMEHLLRAPVTNQSVAYYYAVTATDAAGNTGPLVKTSTATTNNAKGVTTVSLNTPANFVADGNLAEWSNVPSNTIKLSDGSGFLVANTVISGDADLSAKTYVAVNNQYLYVAFDMEDDIVSFNPTLATYLNDAPDLFIGLYNWHGPSHTNLKRGAQPDYHFRFGKDRLMIDGVSTGDSILVPGANYYWDAKFPTGYVIEARISLANLAARLKDSLFVPVNGMRVPIDYSLNDADATGQREGIMTYSPYNEDKSYQTPERWLYTWIGNKWEPTAVNDNEVIATNYNLSQNYPNPFNPSTKITYTIEKPGMVSLRVYDVLGRLVTTLVNQNQISGTYSINFNASNLSSGIYFYKLDSGSFQSIKKMMLIK